MGGLCKHYNPKTRVVPYQNDKVAKLHIGIVPEMFYTGSKLPVVCGNRNRFDVEPRTLGFDIHNTGTLPESLAI